MVALAISKDQRLKAMLMVSKKLVDVFFLLLLEQAPISVGSFGLLQSEPAFKSLFHLLKFRRQFLFLFLR